MNVADSSRPHAVAVGLCGVHRLRGPNVVGNGILLFHRGQMIEAHILVAHIYVLLPDLLGRTQCSRVLIQCLLVGSGVSRIFLTLARLAAAVSWPRCKKAILCQVFSENILVVLAFGTRFLLTVIRGGRIFVRRSL